MTGRAAFVVFLLCALVSPLSAAGKPRSSLLLLIDSSGSMGNEIGKRNSDIKIEAAKAAAQAAVAQATQKGLVEVAVLAFEGGCDNPVPRHLDFTTDTDKLIRFIWSLEPGGGTPMAEAVLFANDFMKRNGVADSTSQLIVLLADGQNDCGDVHEAMRQLQRSGVVFRHETVGFGIEPLSQAAEDLQHIAVQTGGVYHHANDANQLANVFLDLVNTLTVLDIVGKTGGISPTVNISQQTVSVQIQKKKGITRQLLDGLKLP
ncbi:MAG: vWA domain-containing protein [Gammaproteobacteria bacterium]